MDERVRDPELPSWIRRRLRWGERVMHVGTFHWMAYDMTAALTVVVASVLVFALAVDRGLLALTALPGIPWVIAVAGSAANLSARVVVTDTRLLVAGLFGSDSYEIGGVFGAHVVYTRVSRRMGYGRIDLYGVQSGETVRDLTWVQLAGIVNVACPEAIVTALVEAASAKGFTVCDPTHSDSTGEVAAEQAHPADGAR